MTVGGCLLMFFARPPDCFATAYVCLRRSRVLRPMCFCAARMRVLVVPLCFLSFCMYNTPILQVHCRVCALFHVARTAQCPPFDIRWTSWLCVTSPSVCSNLRMHLCVRLVPGGSWRRSLLRGYSCLSSVVALLGASMCLAHPCVGFARSPIVASLCGSVRLRLRFVCAPPVCPGPVLRPSLSSPSARLRSRQCTDPGSAQQWKLVSFALSCRMDISWLVLWPRGVHFLRALGLNRYRVYVGRRERRPSFSTK